MLEAPQDISGLLLAWSDGSEEALNVLIPAVYPELRRIARQHLASPQITRFNPLPWQMRRILN